MPDRFTKYTMFYTTTIQVAKISYPMQAFKQGQVDVLRLLALSDLSTDFWINFIKDSIVKVTTIQTSVVWSQEDFSCSAQPNMITSLS